MEIVNKESALTKSRKRKLVSDVKVTNYKVMVKSDVSNTILLRESHMPVFVSLAKWRTRPTKDMVQQTDRLWNRFKEEGGKVVSAYWTIGRYDAIVTIEAPNEKAALKALMRWGDLLHTETLVAIPRDEAVKLLE